MAVVTNKPYRHSLEILRGLDLLPFFSVIVGGDSCPEKKPHPAPLLRALHELQGISSTAVLIGDHHTDLKAGLAAGLRTCFCAWGLGEDGGIPYDFFAGSPADLPGLFPPGALSP
jgi:phosphoglycolate phosphatase